MTIKFCGATREVTGSCHLITLDSGYKILLDCGLYQGNDPAWEGFNENFLFDPTKIDCLIVSHAHIDHTGRIPGLWRQGFRGEIFSTHATRSLCAIMLQDSAHIQESDAAYHRKKGHRDVQPLYTAADVTAVMSHFTGLSYDRWHYVTEGVKLYFADSGHILGSASVSLEITEGDKVTRVGFTGDIGRPNRPILRDPIPMPQMDYLITESTYGDKEHSSAPAELGQLLDIVTEVCIKNRGKLLIPAFSVGRTQEVVYMLDQLEKAGHLPSIPVFVDSPLAVNATTIFEQHPECFDAELQEHLLNDPNPFGFKNLFYIRSGEESKRLNHWEEPAIIIAASGMMNSGRILHHLRNNISNPHCAVLIVGHCSPNTPGGQLLNGAEELNIFGQKYEVKIKTHVMPSFSAHGDRKEMLAFLQNQQKSAKHLWLVHGDYETQEAWKTYLKTEGHFACPIDIPMLGESFNI